MVPDQTVTILKQPVRFTCLTCSQDWYVPPSNSCPNCDKHSISEPEERVWEIGFLLSFPWLGITAHMRDYARLVAIRSELSVRYLVDLAGEGDYIYRPTARQAAQLDIHHLQIDGVVDNGKPINPLKLLTFCKDLDRIEKVRQPDQKALVHCAAGLRRAPHFVYAYLRRKGLDPLEAWNEVEQARPHAFMHKPYIDSIEDWLASL